MKSYASEGNLKFAYFNDSVKFDTEVMVNYNDIDGEYSDEHKFAQLFVHENLTKTTSSKSVKKRLNGGKATLSIPSLFLTAKKTQMSPKPHVRAL